LQPVVPPPAQLAPPVVPPPLEPAPLLADVLPPREPAPLLPEAIPPLEALAPLDPFEPVPPPAAQKPAWHACPVGQPASGPQLKRKPPRLVSQPASGTANAKVAARVQAFTT
jgi:hypothetical protein